MTEKKPYPPELPNFEDPDFNWEEWDKLGFKGIAQNIVADIESFGTPLIYGIYGPWGSGKTSLMRAIQDHFNRSGGYKTVWFDPWWYDNTEREQLFLGLLRKIEAKIGEGKKTFTDIGLRFGAGVRTVFQLLLDVGLSKLGTSFKNAKKFWKESLEVLGNAQINQVDAVEQTRVNLSSAIDEVLEEGETLVLFVDDLDRCLPERAILLLDQLKNFLHLPRVITVLGVDDEVFARMLNKHYGYEEENFGHQYLKKIVRKPYRINLKTMIELIKQYEEYSHWFRLHSTLINAMGELWGIMAPVNARKLRRCVERFVSLSKVPGISDEITCCVDRITRSNEITWISFMTKVSSYTKISSKEPLELRHAALLLALWEVVALSEELDFPLDNMEHKVLRKLRENQAVPNLQALNEIYDRIATLL